MLKNVMIVSTSESFAIKSMEQKLIAVDISAYQVVARTTDITANIDRAGLIVLYLDERMAAMTASLQNMLSSLNDKLYESNKMLIVIAKRKDYEIALRYISEDFILQYFDRPMNMDSFVQTVFEYMNEGEKKLSEYISTEKNTEPNTVAPVKRKVTSDM